MFSLSIAMGYVFEEVLNAILNNKYVLTNAYNILFAAQVTKTTKTVNQRRLSKQNSVEKPPEGPKIKMLYGKDLKEYENVDVESLLSQLNAEELAQLSEEVDPDDNLLPPSQRCKDQTTKTATGPLNRKKLLTFLTKFAAEQEDWPELKTFQAGVKKGMTALPND